MAEDDLTNASGEGDDVPQIRVPSHDPLPQPPEVHYTRPNLAPKDSSSAGTPRTEYGGGSPGTPDESPSVKYTTGLAGGATLASSILAGYWIGSQIDARWVHTQTPWATIVMVLAGTFGGFYNMFRMINRNGRKK